MGRSHRPRPARLAAKLLQVRAKLGVSQAEMVKLLDYPRIHPAHISGYERGEREPPIPVLLKYARIAGVPMEVLADDDLDLPEHLPAKPGHEWIMKPVRRSVRS